MFPLRLRLSPGTCGSDFGARFLRRDGIVLGEPIITRTSHRFRDSEKFQTEHKINAV